MKPDKTDKKILRCVDLVSNKMVAERECRKIFENMFKYSDEGVDDIAFGLACFEAGRVNKAKEFYDAYGIK
jgi:hypothetical protein